MIHIAIFASGEGSNAERIIRFFSCHPLASVRLLVTDRPQAPVIPKAESHGVKTRILQPHQVNDAPFILSLLSAEQIGWIVLAGYLRKIPEGVIAAFPKRILNIHPALLPAFGGKGMYGINVHKAVLQNHSAESGITIHYVNENYDEGEIIFQKKIPVERHDTPETLSSKIRELEWHYYPKVIERVLKGER